MPQSQSKGIRVNIAVLVFLLVLPAVTPACAATDTDTFQVSITIQGACQVVATNTLDFGTQGILASDIDATTTLSVQCTDGTAYDIGLDAGTGAGATIATRKMTGPASATIDYLIYSDPGRTQLWGVSIPADTVSGTGDGAQQDYTVYGRVPGQTTPAAGTYTDTITVTVTF